MLSGKKRRRRRADTGRRQLCANGHVFRLVLFGAGEEGEEEEEAGGEGEESGHALNVSDGRSVKAARGSTKGATIHSTVQRNDRGSRSARSRPSQVNGHYRRVWRVIHRAPRAAAASPQDDMMGISGDSNYTITSQSALYNVMISLGRTSL